MMSCQDLDEENGKPSSRTDRIFTDTALVFTFTRSALFSLCAVKFGMNLECLEGPMSTFRQVHSDPAHYPSWRQGWELAGFSQE